jgi:L-methionine (R)-S-oxide reductase
MDDAAQAWLEAFVRARGAMAGTVHRLEGDAEAGALAIAAAVNIPEPVVRATRTIPRGKGMAGIAWAEDRAVSTCNLQAAPASEVKPGARAVGAGAAVAFPVHDASGRVRAVVGIAYAEARSLDDAELAALAADGASLP